MPKIHTMAKTHQYCELVGDSQAKNETNDCVVKMMALALRVSYEEAWQICTAAGREPRKGMAPADYMPLLRERLKLTSLPAEAFIVQYPGKHDQLKSVTTHHPDRFKSVWEDGRRYILFCRRHVAYCENGVVHDWTRGTANRVVAIYRIDGEKEQD